ncbi:MAG TPA: hypothetical protein VKK81_04930 [Candidatus Binatia bacterium]|nr:hypothetical protein [Candidatus Binatia bacterium]
MIDWRTLLKALPYTQNEQNRQVGGNFADFADTVARETTEDSIPPLAPPPSPGWLAAWSELAQATYGITPDDSRLRPVMTALAQCDHAFATDDWPAFQRAAVEVKQIVARGVTDG